MIAALRHHPAGITLARGDLAIEVGFERLAEIQEEILWLSEAAHMPVVWATQVLETLAKTGIPSRAECVMLKKGEHIVDAVRSTMPRSRTGWWLKITGEPRCLVFYCP
jgi:pyruvate kinase